MDSRAFGSTGLRVSALGFGCGAVGGLMVRGTAADQERGVARAVAAGITFFDTAPVYGDGASETNLGRVLARLRPEIVLATKVRVGPEERGDIATAIGRSMDASLRRLGRDGVDLLQLHNLISTTGLDGALTPDEVLGEVVPAMERMRDAGKTRFIGITGLGETAAVQRVIDSGRFNSAQVAYNLLNPSAVVEVLPGFPAQDFGRVVARADVAGMGTVGIRAIAGGALSGSVERHPIGMAAVPPIGTGASYEADVERARSFAPLLLDAAATDLVELALRFAIGDGGPTTVLVGISTLEQLDHAIASVARGPLPARVRSRLAPIWAAMANGAG